MSFKWLFIFITFSFTAYASDCVDTHQKVVPFQQYFQLKTGIDPRTNHGEWHHIYSEEMYGGLNRFVDVVGQYQTCIAEYVVEKTAHKK